MILFHTDRHRVQNLSYGGSHIEANTADPPFDMKMQVAPGGHSYMFPANDRHKIIQLLWERNRKTKPTPRIMPNSHYTSRPGIREADLA